MNPYLSIFFTLLFTIYGQVVLKWRLNKIGFEFPDGFQNMILAYLKLLFDPFIFSGFASAFFASIFWMLAVNKLELSKAYPFMSLSPAIVFLIGVFFLGEQFSWGKIVGLVLIFFGILLIVRY